MTFLAHAPNSISETLVFKTDIRATEVGEFRDSLRDGVQTFSLSWRLGDKEAATLAQSARENIIGDWTAPIWCDMTRGVTASAGDTSLNVETDADYRAGEQLVILNSYDDYELCEVVSAAFGIVTISSGLVGDYAGAIVAPVGSFIVPSGFMGSVQFGASNFSAQLIRTDEDDLAADQLPEYLDLDVLNESPKSATITVSVSQENDLVDNSLGVYSIEPIEDYERYRAAVAFSDHSYAARWERREFVHKMRGRDRPFWLPTWKRDMFVSSGAVSATAALTVSLTVTDAASLVGKHIQIIEGDEVLYREIEAAEIDGENVNLALSDTHGQFISTDAYVSLMHKVRFDTDAFTMTHTFAASGFSTKINANVVEVIE